MRSSARSALPTLLTSVCFAVSLYAQSPGKQPPINMPRSSVSGRITIKDKPAPGVLVGLRGNEMRSVYDPFTRAVTDDNGNYRIANIAAGTYQIAISAPGYVPADRTYAKVMVVGEDENVENINFSLVRGGVITGKVTDADGRPAIQHQVAIYDLPTLERYNPQQRPFPTMTGQTDDRGIYRIFGIAPGRYKVAAGRGSEGYVGISPTQVSYKQIFHPDVTDPAKAPVIEVAEGSEAKDIDIALGRPVQSFSVKGRTISNDTGAPVPNIRFGLQRILSPQQVEVVNNIVIADARGNFVVEGLIPGKYGATMFFGDGNELRWDTTTFEVIDQDVTDVVLKLSRGSVVSGVVVLESDSKAAQRLLAETLVRAHVQTAPGFGTSTSSPIAADGGFRLSGLANGVVTIAITQNMTPYPPKGLSISRIERDGVPAPRIEVKDGELLTGVKIFISYGTAVLRGTVKIDNGSLPQGAGIFLRLKKSGNNAPDVRPLQVDQRGNFLIEGLAPGQYEITAQIYGLNVRAPKPVQQEVVLSDGAVTEATIRIDLATVTNPQ